MPGVLWLIPGADWRRPRACAGDEQPDLGREAVPRQRLREGVVVPAELR